MVMYDRTGEFYEIDRPADEKSMIHKLFMAKTFRNIAENSIMIELEARCRTADALERIADALQSR